MPMRFAHTASFQNPYISLGLTWAAPFGKFGWSLAFGLDTVNF